MGNLKRGIFCIKKEIKIFLKNIGSTNKLSFKMIAGNRNGNRRIVFKFSIKIVPTKYKFKLTTSGDIVSVKHKLA